MSGFGITGMGVHVPRLRLDRKALVDHHGWSHPGLKALARGQRSFADWDEDPVTMAVEAARNALSAGRADRVEGVTLASTSAPFADRQNAGIIAAALGLGERVASRDVGGSLRAGTGALLAALQAGQPGLVLAAEQRRAKAASAQEAAFGDAAAALTLGRDGVLAELVAGVTLSVDFVDHYRSAGADYDYGWEERWVRDEGWLKILPRALTGVLAEAGLKADQVTGLILPPVPLVVARRIATTVGIAPDALTDSLTDRIGDSGAAHPLLLLALALEQAKAGDLLLVAGFGQGADALLLRATGVQWPGPSPAALISAGRVETGYGRFAALTGAIDRDEGMRAELDLQTPLTVLYRNSAMLTGLVGGRCRSCGTAQFPAGIVCVNPACNGWHSQDDWRFADDTARVVTWTADHLTYCPSPPACYGLIQFDQGGRMLVAYADAEPGDLAVGAPVRMVFRVKDYDRRRDFRRYFWKAVPLRTGEGSGHGQRHS